MLAKHSDFDEPVLSREISTWQHGLTRLGQDGGSIGRKSGGFNPNLSGCSLIDEHALRAIVLSLREQCSLLHTAELCFV